MDRDQVLALSFKPQDPATTEAAPPSDFAVLRATELGFCTYNQGNPDEYQLKGLYNSLSFLDNKTEP
jgi:hypothetical protein